MHHIVVVRTKDMGEKQRFSEVSNRLEHHPETWTRYPDTPEGVLDVVEMEYTELVVCENANDRHGVRKELVDLAAACMRALKHY